MLLSINEAAGLLGVSRRGIYRLKDAGEIETVKFGQSQRGGRRLVVRSSLEAYIQRERHRNH